MKSLYGLTSRRHSLSLANWRSLLGLDLYLRAFRMEAFAFLWRERPWRVTSEALELRVTSQPLEKSLNYVFERMWGRFASYDPGRIRIGHNT